MATNEKEMVLIVGVGSRMRGDDSVGPFVIDMLKERMDEEGCPDSHRFSLIDADVMPENFSKPIRESGADLCIFIDAVDIGKPPGKARRIPEGMIDPAIPCSHSLPLSYLIKYIEEKVPRVELIGIQIGTTGLYREMTEEVKKGARELAEVLWAGGWDRIEVHDGKRDKAGEATNYCW